jgi:hypothetical protein
MAARWDATDEEGMIRIRRGGTHVEETSDREKEKYMQESSGTRRGGGGGEKERDR